MRSMATNSFADEVGNFKLATNTHRYPRDPEKQEQNAAARFLAVKSFPLLSIATPLFRTDVEKNPDSAVVSK